MASKENYIVWTEDGAWLAAGQLFDFFLYDELLKGYSSCQCEYVGHNEDVLCYKIIADDDIISLEIDRDK